MNHLIPYKLFESSSEYDNMIQDIKDISVDLLDDGFGVKIYPHYSSRFFRVRVFNGYDFDVKYIRPTLDRMHECAKSYGYDEIIIGVVPSSQGSTSNDVLPGGFMIEFFSTKLPNISTVSNESVFENHENDASTIIEHINDILLELSDENWDNEKDRFRVLVKPIGNPRNKSGSGISIGIHRDSGFVRRDVYPVLDRVDEYMLSEGYTKYGQDIFDGYNCNVVYGYNPKVVNESKFNWEFYKKHPDVTGIASDVLSELEDKFKIKMEPLTYELAYGATDEVLSIDIKPSIRVTGYVFSFYEIKNVVTELISQLEGNGMKFYRYNIESKPNWPGNWSRGVKDILNDNITRNKIYGFTIEFKSLST